MEPKPQSKPRVRVRAGRMGRPLDLGGEQTVIAGELLRSYMPMPGGNRIQYLPIDEIIARRGWKDYRDMRADDQVKACMAFKKILVYGRAWDVKPADESEDAKSIAKYTQWLLERANFPQLVREALSAFDFGFSYAEQVFEIADWDGKPVVALKALKFRDPESIRINVDRHGNIIDFEQITHWVEHVNIAPEKSFHYAHAVEFSDHYGRSDLRAAYRSWWAKKFIINFWNVFLERMGSPMTMMKYPMGAPDELKNALKAILAGLSAKTEILVPEGVEVELIEATRAGNADYTAAVGYHDKCIARAILMIGLLGLSVDNAARGSDSQSRLHLRVLFKMAETIGNEVLETFMKQIVRPMIDRNFEHKDLYPKVFWQDYGEFEGIEVADTIRLLHAAGIVDMNQDDVNYARSILGLPLRGEDDPEDEVVRPQPLPPPADPNKPPPSAEQGNEKAKKGGGGARKTEPGSTDLRT